MKIFKDKYYHYYLIHFTYCPEYDNFCNKVDLLLDRGDAKLVTPIILFRGEQDYHSKIASFYDRFSKFAEEETTEPPKSISNRFLTILIRAKKNIPELEEKLDSGVCESNRDLLTKILYTLRKRYVDVANTTPVVEEDLFELCFFDLECEKMRLRVLYETAYVLSNVVFCGDALSGLFSIRVSHIKSPEERRKPDLNKFLSSIQSFFRKLEVGWISGLNGNKETFTLTKDQDEIYSNTCPEYSPHRLLTIDGDNWSNSLISFIKKDLISSEGALPFDKIGIIDSNFACVFWKFVESTSLFIEGDLWDGYKISEVLEAAERLDICLDIIYENEGNYILRLPEGVVGEKASSNIYFSDLSTLTNLENLSEEWSNTKEYWSSVYSTLVSYFNKYNHIRDTVFKQTFKKPKDGEKDKRKMAFNLMSSFSYDGDAMPLVLEKEDLKSIIRLAKYFSGNVELNLSNYVPTSNMTTINPELLIDKIQELFKVDRLLIALVAVFIVTT